MDEVTSIMKVKLGQVYSEIASAGWHYAESLGALTLSITIVSMTTSSIITLSIVKLRSTIERFITWKLMFAGKAYGLRGSIVKHLLIYINNINKMS